MKITTEFGANDTMTARTPVAGAATGEIAKPGVYDLRPEVYHADPVAGGSLSATGARKLLPPSCPAKYKAWADGGVDQRSAARELGSAAHATLLGIGDPIVVVDAEDWRTKAARAERDEAYAAGAVPLLAADHELVVAMAEALHRHPVAGALIRPDTGKAEQTLIWQDQVTGVWRRALLDWLPHPTPSPHIVGTRLIISDYKTTHCADPSYLAKAMFDFGYYQQADWYIAGAEALNLADEIHFLMICQEKEPPYLVTVVEPDFLALQRGRMRNRKALDLFRECSASGVWPGYGVWPTYSNEVIPLALPPWADKQLESASERGAYDTMEDRS